MSTRCKLWFVIEELRACSSHWPRLIGIHRVGGLVQAASAWNTVCRFSTSLFGRRPCPLAQRPAGSRRRRSNHQMLSPAYLVWLWLSVGLWLLCGSHPSKRPASLWGPTSTKNAHLHCHSLRLLKYRVLIILPSSCTTTTLYKADPLEVPHIQFLENKLATDYSARSLDYKKQTWKPTNSYRTRTRRHHILPTRRHKLHGLMDLHYIGHKFLESCIVLPKSMSLQFLIWL